LEAFSKGLGREPQFLVGELTEGLGSKWQTVNVCVKPYAAMAGTHGMIDSVRKLQEDYPKEMEYIEGIESIKVMMREVAYHHGGWKAERPLASVGGQMSCAYVAATQMVDREMMPRQFRSRCWKGTMFGDWWTRLLVFKVMERTKGNG
jgi:aconitate decarboxylase